MGASRGHTQRSGSEQTVCQNGESTVVQRRGQTESVDYDSGQLCSRPGGEDCAELDCAAAQGAQPKFQERNHSLAFSTFHWNISMVLYYFRPIIFHIQIAVCRFLLYSHRLIYKIYL